MACSFSLYGARYYDPRTSVWQSPDPILNEYMDGQTNGGVFNPKNLGLFTYTYNNPVNLVDPDGNNPGVLIFLFGSPEGLALLGITGGAVATSEPVRNSTQSLINDIKYNMSGTSETGLDANGDTNDNHTTAAPSSNDISLGTPMSPGNGGDDENNDRDKQESKIQITSRIKENPKLVKEAEAAGKSHQGSINKLVKELSRGNKNPGIGTKPIGRGLSEARARDGARVYFKETKQGIEILGKSNKANQSKVIKEVLNTFGK